MSRISTLFNHNDHKALIAYITVGYPDSETTLEAAMLLAEAGCDLIELGIPFSDPLADGVTIQKASHQALLNGINVSKCLETAEKISTRVKIPLVFMSYINPIINYGIDRFCADCAKSGISGLIIPDLPPGELVTFNGHAQKYDIDIIHFLAPNSSDERIKEIGELTTGFIYLVSVTGVTGVRESNSSDLNTLVNKVKKIADKPVCVGFGISSREQAVNAARTADGVIIGSRIIQFLETTRSPYSKLQAFIKDIREGLSAVN